MHVFLVFCFSSLGGVFCNSFLVKGPVDMRPVLINRREQWTFSQPSILHLLVEKGIACKKLTFFLG